MAGTQGFINRSVESQSSWRTALSVGLAATVGLVLAHGYFSDSERAVGQRGDRIDFSSMATVVSLEDYAKSDFRTLRSEAKDDRLSVDILPVVLTTTNSAKADFRQHDVEVPHLTQLIARHAAKLHGHLETGLVANAAGQSTVPGHRDGDGIDLKGTVALSAALHRTGMSLAPSPSAARSIGRNGLGASLSRSGPARQGGLSGLAN
jgi:hypothetical protein